MPGPQEDSAAHIRELLEELGPTFVKLGQLLSTRPDIVPEPYLRELAKLQDTAAQLSFAEIKAVIETEFGAPLESIFPQFEETPTAAASLAQVHAARLADGTPVIVKVQRPRIREQVETDIEILYKRAKFLESHWERARTYGITEVVDEFALTIREELDFTREANNTDRLRQAMAAAPGIKLPLVYWELTTGKVLTLEHLQGIKITDLPAAASPGVDPKAVAVRFASVFLEQVFVHGFFHADPHPGNILVNEAGEIELLDCGQVGRIDATNKAGAVRMLLAFEQRDSRALADEILNLGIYQGEVDGRKLSEDLDKLLRTYYDAPAGAVNMGQLLVRVLNVSAAHKIRLPVIFAVLGKVFANLDGICRQLDPNFNFTATARTYARKALKSELRGENTLMEIYNTLLGLRSFLFALPGNLDRLLRKAVEGSLRVEFKHQGLEQLSDTFRASANRLAIALIVGAIIVGSSLVVVAGKGPTSLFGLPVLGIVGYILASFFGIWLIISILRSGGHK
jgi:ubiquinone biosynthesis protein